MKRVIEMSRVWTTACLLGLLLTGCGGSSSSPATEIGDNSSGGGTPPVGVETKPPEIPETPENPETPPQVEERKAVLSWSAPSERVNGEGIAMGELDKYVIRYGTDPHNLEEQVVIDEAASKPSMTYVIDNLDVGTWYFTIQVEDVNGLISEPSEAVSKTFQS